MSEKQYKFKFVLRKHVYFWYVPAFIENQKWKKQDLQAKESWCQDANSTTSYIQKEKTKRNRDMNQESFRLKNSRNILG